MGTRRIVLANNQIYHIYNRGVDKRDISCNSKDSDRFIRDMLAFNTGQPIRLRDNRYTLQTQQKDSLDIFSYDDPLVEIIAYCLNPNHFHLMLRQMSDGGISEFMKRLSGGYTWWFNDKYKRSGSLFQGRFKSEHVNSDSYLLRLSVYVNLNFRVHGYEKDISNRIRSSWSEFVGDSLREMCAKDIILDLFGTKKEYKQFAEQSVKESIMKKKIEKEFPFI